MLVECNGLKGHSRKIFLTEMKMEGERRCLMEKASEPEVVNLLKNPGIDSQPGGIDSLESIPRLLMRLQIRAVA
jgi:hypothetical protein